MDFDLYSYTKHITVQPSVLHTYLRDVHGVYNDYLACSEY